MSTHPYQMGAGPYQTSAHPYQMGSKLLPDERGSAPLPNAYTISTRNDVVGVTGNADVTTADVLPLVLMST